MDKKYGNDKKNKQMAPADDDEEYVYSCTDTVVSGTECTGLIQTPPESESEAESYTDLYTIPKPSQNRNPGTRKKKKGTGREGR
ncbi:MAG: hypothetical protein LKJ21_07700 [Oscillospiraceae bacterium]|jgi:hypothetical protein|nr:hypothetical protein [Oscillospiraceae bacterium]MCI1990645.1 hypothetical protein [Oscillospiraceae bacterium]